MTTPLIPVILCGGTGTRLWPLSRASYPKQYWPLGGSGEETLLQQTQQRLEGIIWAIFHTSLAPVVKGTIGLGGCLST